jgi:hypothetical protein
MLPELTETAKEAARSSPHWLIYLAFLVLSALGAMLGFQYVGPGERLEKVEAKVEVLQHHEDAHEQQDSTMIRWMCVKSTPTERQYVGLHCQ